MRFNGICLSTQDVPKPRDFYRNVLQVAAEGDDPFTILATQRAELFIYYIEQGREWHPVRCNIQAAEHTRLSLKYKMWVKNTNAYKQWAPLL